VVARFETAFPQIEVQLGIVHQIRNRMRKVAFKPQGVYGGIEASLSCNDPGEAEYAFGHTGGNIG